MRAQASIAINCFGDHRHVDDYAIAFFDALLPKRAGKVGNFVQKLTISERLYDRRLQDYCR